MSFEVGGSAAADFSANRAPSLAEAAADVSAPAFDGGTPVSHGHIDNYNKDVAVMQERMQAAGIDPGPIDGLKGPLTRAAMSKYHKQFGKSAADGLNVDPSFAEFSREHNAAKRDILTLPSGKTSELGLPGGTPASGAAVPGSNLDIGATKDGHTLPSTGGKATTFWNGRYAYKGKRDPDNMSLGAWGDQNKPTDYFAAIPVGLKGGGNWWHNQKLLVTNPRTGKQVVVPVQDKGPGPRTGAAIDLSPVAKEALGVDFMDNINVKISFARPDAPIGPVR
jgi:peptidoglycan hydrolase-like protein with peptidoglycan-binding domain